MKIDLAVEGIRIGHAQNEEAQTGCTVVLCEEGAVCGVDVRGGAPGTRETALLNPLCTVNRVHAVLLSGGSAYGLDAAGGVMRYLEEKGCGFDVGVAKVPIVPAAVLFDLAVGDAGIRPDAEMGYCACECATSVAVQTGRVGAGTGSSVGKLLGFEYAVPGGIGIANVSIGEGVVVSAVVAVNAVGDVYNPDTQEIIGGAKDSASGLFLDASKKILEGGNTGGFPGGNTTIGVVFTNAKLSKTEANKVAQMAHNGYAQTIRPVHTSLDGDTVFALSYGDKDASVDAVGYAASQAVVAAVLNAFK